MNGEVLPTTISIASLALSVPSSATVSGTGDFSFPISAQPGLFGNKPLGLSFSAVRGMVQQVFQVQVEAAPLVDVFVSPATTNERDGGWWTFGGVANTTARIDDSLNVRVSSEVLPAAATVRLQWADGGTNGNQTPTCCGSLPCLCFSVGTFNVPLRQLTDTFELRVDAGINGTPMAGKMADGGLPTVAITRLLWQRQFAGPPLHVAIDADQSMRHELYVATGAPQPELHRLTHLGATVGTRTTVPTPITGLAIDPGRAVQSDSTVYFTSTEGATAMTSGTSQNLAGTGPIHTVLALAARSPIDAGLGAVLHLSAVADAGPAQFVHFYPGSSNVSVPTTDDFDPVPIQSSPSALRSIAVARDLSVLESSVFSMSSTGQTPRLSLRSLGASFSEVGQFTIPVITEFRGLAATRDGGVAISHENRLLLPDGRDVFGRSSPPVVDRYGGVWVGGQPSGVSTSTVLWAADGGMQEFPIGNLDVSPVLVGSTSEFTYVYSVSGGGTLMGLSVLGTPEVVLQEQLPLGPFITVKAPLAVTCTPFNSFRRNVVLYVSNAPSGTLTAVLVPGYRPDLEAHWPMWQKDQFRSGNASLRLPGCN